MKVQLLEQQVYLIHHTNKTFNRILKFISESMFLQNPNSMIIEMSKNKNAIDINSLELIQKKLQALELILVLVSKNSAPNDFLDHIIWVPTVIEAIDYIELDRLQKHLYD